MNFEILRYYLINFILFVKHFATEFVDFMFEPFIVSGVEVIPLEFLLGAFITVTIIKLIIGLFTPS